jgi:putative phage-type endonuclease
MTEPVFVGDFPAGSDEWHAARKHGLGGSEIAAVLGLSPWESRFSLWHRKMGLASPIVMTDAMHWGNVLEPVIRDEWNRRHDGEMFAQAAGTWSHYQHPWMVANPDGIVRRYIRPSVAQVDSLLEVKTSRDADGWGEPGTDEIPIYYRTQALWYLDVFGLDVCHFAVLIGGSDYREYRVEYSADEAEFMRSKARDFLDDLDTGKRPSIDEHNATYQVIRDLHPDIVDERIDVPGPMATAYLAAIDAHKAASAEKQRTTAILADHMGSARRAYFDGQQIAMRVSRGITGPSVRHTPTKTTGQKVSAA